MDSCLANFAGKSVLITGATGFTGSCLTRKLVEAGANVRAIARPSSKKAQLAALPIQWFHGNVYEESLVREAMAGIHYVFHIATLYRTATATEDEHRRVHVDSTRLLAEAALGQPEFNRFVLVSTVGVHGHIEHPPADETAPFNPGDEYQRTKAEAEQWLTKFAGEKKLPFAIIRPSAIYGPGDERLLKIFRMANHRFSPVLGRRPCLYHLIHVEDLANIIALAATHPDAAGEVFIAGNPEPIPLDHMLQLIAGALNRKTSIIRLPVAPFWWLAILCEAVCPRLGISPPLYRRRIKFFLNDRAFDTRKVRDRLGYRFVIAEEAGLAETARWYRDHGML